MAVNDLASLLLAEAGGKDAAARYRDMQHIASVIHNRALATGRSVQEIIEADGQFAAWGKPLPPGVEKYAPLAMRAIQHVAKAGPVTPAQFYATPKATGNLPKGLKQETSTGSHVYFTDPQGRAIRTTTGYAKPVNLDSIAATPQEAPRPTARPGADAAVFSPPLQAPQLPDLASVPARSVTASSVAPAVDLNAAVPPVPVQARAITPGAGLGNLVPGYGGRGAPAAGTAAMSPYDARRAGGLPDGPLPMSGPPGAIFADREMTDPINYSRHANANAQPFAGAVIHHSEPVTLDRTRAVTNSPRENGTYRGYSYAIDPAGNVGLLAPLDQRTNHIGQIASNRGDLSNANALGITLTDAYNPATGKQIAAAGELLSALNRAGFAAPDGSPAFDPLALAYHGKGATDARPVEGQAEAAAIAAYMGGMPFGRHTPTPTPRPDPAAPAFPSLPAEIPAPAPALAFAQPEATPAAFKAPANVAIGTASRSLPTSFAGGTSPRRAEAEGMARYNLSQPPSPVPMPSPQLSGLPGPAPVPMAATSTFPSGIPAVPMPEPTFSRVQRDFAGGMSPRRAEAESMAMYGLGLPADREAMPAGRAGPFSPAYPGGPITMAPPAAVPMPASVPPSVPSPFRPDNMAAAGPRGNSSVPALPDLPMTAPIPSPALRSQMLAQPMGIPQTFAAPPVDIPAVAVPEVMPPVPTPAPRNSARDLLGGLGGPAAAQIGRNMRSNFRGEWINPFAGIPAAYRASFRDFGNRFNGMFGGSLPPATPFSVGRGLAAIEAVRAGGLAPGATAHSLSNPGASWSVNPYGFAEYTSAHGFSGRPPSDF